MPRPPKLNPQQARLLIEFYLESGSISEAARRFGVSRSTAARIIRLNGESTLPEHNRNRKLKNPKPVKEYGYNKADKRWNVYTTRSKRKSTKLSPAEFTELKNQADEALATAGDLEAERRELRARHEKVVRYFRDAPNIRKWLKGRNRFVPPLGPRRGSYRIFSLGDAQKALDEMLAAVRRGWWRGQSVDHIFKMQERQKIKAEAYPNSYVYIPKLPPNVVIDEDSAYVKGLPPTKKDIAAAEEWERIRPSFIADQAQEEVVHIFKVLAAQEHAELKPQDKARQLIADEP